MKTKVRDVLYSSDDDVFVAAVWMENGAWSGAAGNLGTYETETVSHENFVSAAVWATGKVIEYERNRSATV